MLSTTIDKYIYISCRYLPPYLGTKHRVVWRHVEQVDSIAEILHPAVREGLRYLEFDDSLGIELHYQGDLPSRSGMGSSSTFVVALLQALTLPARIEADHRRLAEMAIELEQVAHEGETSARRTRWPRRSAGSTSINFAPDGSFDVNPIRLVSRSVSASLSAQPHAVLPRPEPTVIGRCQQRHAEPAPAQQQRTPHGRDGRRRGRDPAHGDLLDDFGAPAARGLGSSNAA